MKKYKWLNWVSFVLVAFGFVMAHGWLDSVEALNPVKDFSRYFMLGGVALSFIFGGAISWLGLALVGLGFAWGIGWVLIPISNVNHVTTSLYLMLTGYLMVFFSERDM